MNIVQQLEQEMMNRELPEFSTGDTVIVNVKVKEVRTVNSHPKKKRVGRYTGMTNKYKKAYVTLKEGNSISFN